uniref:Uncharacterized protein n=1 Tax=Sphaeramia orbicularis TaxID=375764 RepID=A0A672YZ38_9TELE
NVFAQNATTYDTTERTRLSVGSDQIPQDRIMTLVSSMRRRCTACLEARGGPSP